MKALLLGVDIASEALPIFVALSLHVPTTQAAGMRSVPTYPTNTQLPIG